MTIRIPWPVGFIAQIRNSIQYPRSNQVSNSFNQARFIRQVWQFRYNDAGFTLPMSSTWTWPYVP